MIRAGKYYQTRSGGVVYCTHVDDLYGAHIRPCRGGNAKSPFRVFAGTGRWLRSVECPDDITGPAPRHPAMDAARLLAAVAFFGPAVIFALISLAFVALTYAFRTAGDKALILLAPRASKKDQSNV